MVFIAATSKFLLLIIVKTKKLKTNEIYPALDKDKNPPIIGKYKNTFLIPVKVLLYAYKPMKNELAIKPAALLGSNQKPVNRTKFKSKN
jgi:hypothetical protein